MNITDFFREFLAPHAKNIEADHYHDLPHLDILSSLVITEKDQGVEVDLKKLPAPVVEKLTAIVNERSKFLNFTVSLSGA